MALEIEEQNKRTHPKSVFLGQILTCQKIDFLHFFSNRSQQNRILRARAKKSKITPRISPKIRLFSFFTCGAKQQRHRGGGFDLLWVLPTKFEISQNWGK
jgi:hypothetical protein